MVHSMVDSFLKTKCVHPFINKSIIGMDATGEPFLPILYKMGVWEDFFERYVFSIMALFISPLLGGLKTSV